ncbi:MAG: amidohydrolase [Longicatena sp.]
MKTIYYNGNIITMDEKTPFGEAICCEDGSILKVGSKEYVFSIKDETTKLVDLKGKTMTPGFIDAHSHLVSLANSQQQVDISRATCFEDVVRMIKDFISKAKLEKGKWVVAAGYDQNFMREKQHPNRYILDEASTTHPILISHVSSHMGVANSLALDILGINEQTKDMDGGLFMRLKDSMIPSGYMEENAFIWAQKQVPMIDTEEMLKLMVKAQHIYASYGITTIQDGMVVNELFSLLSYAASKHLLFLDVVGYVDLNQAHALTSQYKEYVKQYHNRFKLGGYKIFLDGSPQGRTAWMSTPYIGEKDYCGYPTLSDEHLYELIKTALQEHMQLLAHCNGDSAANQYITQFEKVVKQEHSKDTFRPVMIHAQLLRKDQLPNMASLHMTPSFFIAHTYYWGDVHIKNFGLERAKAISCAKSSAALGLRYTFHQDSPVIMPDMMETLWCATNRRSKEGIILGEEECVSVQEALKAITINGAYQYFEEDKKGSLSEGKLADFVILDKNPYTIPKEDLREIQVLETYKEGVCVYQKTTTLK